MIYLTVALAYLGIAIASTQAATHYSARKKVFIGG